MKRWIAALLCLCCLAAQLGCGKKENRVPELEAARESGQLKIGVTECPPFCRKEADGSWSGFDVELARLVCRELELEPVFVEFPWDTREEALASGQADCLWSCLTARSDLTGTMDFSLTYLASRPALVVKTGEGISAQGAVVAVEVGSAGESAMAVCLSEAVTYPVASQLEALEAVLAGKVEGAVVDYLVARAAADENPLLTVAENQSLGTEELAVGLRKNSDLTPAVNQVLENLQADGTLAALAEQYGLTDSLIVG